MPVVPTSKINVLTDLPIEIWGIVLRELSPTDIFSMMQANKQCYQIASSNDVWKFIVLETWYQEESRSESIDIDACLNNHSFFYKLYKYRARKDMVLRGFLNDLRSRSAPIDKNDLSAILDGIYLNEDDNIPELIRLTQHLNESHKDDKVGGYTIGTYTDHLKSRLPNIRVINLASELLKSIRYRKVCKSVFNIASGKGDLWLPDDMEGFFVELSQVDPYFYKFMKTRCRVLENTIKRHKDRYDDHEGLAEGKTITDMVIDLARDLNVSIREQAEPLSDNSFLNSSTFAAGSDLLTESSFITRVYASYTPNNQVFLTAILEKLCHHFKYPVKSEFSSYIASLCIRDEKQRTGASKLLFINNKITIQDAYWSGVLDPNNIYLRERKKSLCLIASDWMRQLGDRASSAKNIDYKQLYSVSDPDNPGSYKPFLLYESSNHPSQSTLIVRNRVNKKNDRFFINGFQKQIIGTEQYFKEDAKLFNYLGDYLLYICAMDDPNTPMPPFHNNQGFESMSPFIHYGLYRLFQDLGMHPLAEIFYDTFSNLDELRDSPQPVSPFLKMKVPSGYEVGRMVRFKGVNQYGILWHYSLSPYDEPNIGGEEAVFGSCITQNSSIITTNIKNCIPCVPTMERVLSFLESDKLGEIFDRFDRGKGIFILKNN